MRDVIQPTVFDQNENRTKAAPRQTGSDYEYSEKTFTSRPLSFKNVAEKRYL